jgi:DNA-binding MarR family transcriptional regulator
MTNETIDSKRRAELIDHVARNLLSRSALLVRLLVRQVRSGVISRTEGEVLGILTRGARRVTELAELEGVAQPTMTLLIKRLEERGWVERKRLAEDGRVVMVSITPTGAEMFDGFRANFHSALRDDLEGSSDEEILALHDVTETLGSFVDELQRRVGG